MWLNFFFATVVLSALIWNTISAQETDWQGTNSVINIWGGYTTLGMNGVNSDLSTIAGSGGSVTKVKKGYAIAVEYLYAVMSRFLIGPRIEYIGGNQGEASNLSVNVKQDFYLIPIMVGGRYYLKDRKSPWNVSGGVFAGVGIGYGKTKTDVPLLSATTTYKGSAFTADMIVCGEYNISSVISFGLDLGYRFANVSKMSGGSSGDGSSGSGSYYSTNVKKSAVVNSAGKKIKYDFSGLISNIGINFKF
ncbi:MAG: hypothetical protein Q7K21_06805 [Elusimicrobiota bacterium]|nr:hypothetical protein [Elusimicrobiota bacterium]